LNHFRGSELQNYFTKILEDDLKALIKPQYVDQIPKAVKGTVQQLLDKKDERKNQNEICRLLGKPAWNIHLGAQISDARSPRQLNSVRWHLIFVGPQYLTCIMSPFWHLEF
jgi:hypothetical protein